MKGEPLANAGGVIVPEAKITRYLLSETHADGRGKARFFTAHGFSSAQWGIMAAALRDHAMTHVVVEEAQTPFGVRYVLEGPFPSPDGRSPNVRVVWFVRTGSDVPELVTAYPMKRRP